MPDAMFADPRLSPLYDTFDGPRDDLPLYAGLATELGAQRVLDVGCGTGRLAILLARTGRAVTAADPAAASLEVAKSQDPNAAVNWVHAAADRKASVLRVNAIHQDVRFTPAMMKAVRDEIDDLSSWLGLSSVEYATPH